MPRSRLTPIKQLFRCFIDPRWIPLCTMDIGISRTEICSGDFPDVLPVRIEFFYPPIIPAAQALPSIV
jgi:hypothetical protein